MTAWCRGVSVTTLFGLLLVAPANARADVVLDWNKIAVETAILQAPPTGPGPAVNPFQQARFGAIVHLAMFEAVNAITGDYEPYLGSIAAPQGASAEAAAVAAAHRVLTTYFPWRAATLDAARATSLAAIPDGQAKMDGIATGEAAAAALIALRAADGSALTFYDPAPWPALPSWQATPGCPLKPGSTTERRGTLFNWQDVTPFGIPNAAAFMPVPPPSLSSNQYLKDYNEVMAVGGTNSTQRPADRADVVLFYAAASPTYLWSLAARQLASARADTLSENARAFALINMAINDALIVSFKTKYTHLYWRPETAIRAGGGNARAVGDPSFAPFITTPCFPSYPSNHASGTNGGAEMLRRLYGEAGHRIELFNPFLPATSPVAGLTLSYGSFNEICNDVDDARVYGGIHFRFDQVAGNQLGRDVATYVYKNNLRKVH